MAEPKDNLLMEKIVSLCKRRGFVFQSSEIYGGINGFWDYGPLGAELKRNVKELWWNTMTRQRDDVAGLEATIIMSPLIWKASGHVDTFADMMRECSLSNKRVRADQVDAQSGTVFRYSGASSTQTGLKLDKPVAIRPLLVSKLNTVAQISFAAAVLAAKAFAFPLGMWFTVSLYIVAALTLASAAAYLTQWVRHMDL